MEDILKNNDKSVKLHNDLENKLQKVKKNIDLQATYIDKIYKDKLKGIIDEDMFIRQYNLLAEETQKLKNNKHELELNIYIILKIKSVQKITNNTNKL